MGIIPRPLFLPKEFLRFCPQVKIYDKKGTRSCHEPMLWLPWVCQRLFYTIHVLYNQYNDRGVCPPRPLFYCIIITGESLTLRMIDLVSCVLTRAQTQRVLSKESEQSEYQLEDLLRGKFF